MSRIIFYAFVFVSGYIASRSLSAEDFGQLHYITFLVNVLWMFTNLGMPGLLSRYFPKAFQNGHKQSIHQLLVLAGLTLLITTVLVSMLFVFLFNHANSSLPIGPLLVFASVQLVFTYLNILIQSVYDYRTVFVANLVACISGVLFLFLGIENLGPIAYIYAFILVYTIVSIAYLAMIGRALIRVQESDLSFSLPPPAELLRMALYFAISAILAGLVWQRFELSILKNYFDYTHLAIYGVAFTVIALFAEPLKLIPGVLLYYFANMDDKHREASNQFEQFFKYFCWMVVFLGAFIWIDAKPLVVLLYTDTYSESAKYVQILMPGIVLGVCGYALMSIHVGLGKARFLMIQDVLTASLFLGLALGLIPTTGLEGAAWAKAIAITFSVFLGLLYTHYRLKYSIPFKSLLFSLGLSILMMAPFRGAFTDAWIPMILKFVLMLSAYIVISYATRMIDRSVFRKVLNEFRFK